MSESENFDNRSSRRSGPASNDEDLCSDRKTIEKLLHFLAIDEETKRQGAEIWELLLPHADKIIADFYRNIHATRIKPQISRETVERLKVKQKAHWAELFGARFTDDYARSAQRIGIRHRDLQLSATWYVAGYMELKIQFINIVILSDLPTLEKGHLLRALEKFVALDMALALSAYDDDAIFID